MTCERSFILISIGTPFLQTINPLFLAYPPSYDLKQANRIHLPLSNQRFQLVLPTNTTWTLAKAAAAAKISTLFASVIKLKQIEKVSVKADTMPSLAVIFLTNDRIIIAAIGISEDMTVETRRESRRSGRVR